MGGNEQTRLDRKRRRAGMWLLNPPHQLVPASDLLGCEKARLRPEQTVEQGVPRMRAQAVAPVVVRDRVPAWVCESSESAQADLVAGRGRGEHRTWNHREARLERVEALVDYLPRGVFSHEPVRDMPDGGGLAQFLGSAAD